MQLLSIVPHHSHLQAELAVPTTGIGFIRPGQPVRLAVDAFPFERFGTVSGRVTTVAASAVRRDAGPNRFDFVYPVTVEIPQASVIACGRHEPLVPGMTVAARVVLDRQSLIEWLFEPVLALRRQ